MCILIGRKFLNKLMHQIITTIKSKVKSQQLIINNTNLFDFKPHNNGLH